MARSRLFDYEHDQVLVEGNSSVRKVILNRPRRLNCLSFEMVSQLLKTFKALELDPEVKLVIFKANGNAFCTGGDVINVIRFTLSGHWSFAASFYFNLLTLEYLLATYGKPMVALINGMVMGAGAGMTMNGRFRIVTEKTLFAMPEAALGLFADVGSSHFLSKLPGFFGEYLGLTGARIDGSEMFACGLATHFIPTKSLPLLEKALSELGCVDASTVIDIVNKFHYPQPLKPESALRRLDIISKCFSRKTIEEILASLENETAKSPDKWIDETLNRMKAASPTSLKITLRTIREGRGQRLEQCLSQDYTIFRHCIRRTISSDFYEGARAKLFDKDGKPKWEPSKLEQVSEEMLDRCFADVADDEAWDRLEFRVRSSPAGSSTRRGTYDSYPLNIASRL